MLKISDNLICKISANTLTIRTRDGGDFLHGDDGIDRPRWNLYFAEDNGIVAEADASNTNAPQLTEFGTEIEGVSEQYFTQVWWWHSNNIIIKVIILKWGKADP